MADTNIFTQAGEELVADALTPGGSAPTNWYVGWGTGAGTAAKGDTTLSTEASESRVVTTNTQPSADVNQFVGTITVAGADKTITNAGIFNAATTGILLLHSSFTGLPLTIGNSIQFTFQLTWS
jgi:hypothetical protein